MSNLTLAPGTRIRVSSPSRLAHGQTLVVVLLSKHGTSWLCTDTGSSQTFQRGGWFDRDELIVEGDPARTQQLVAMSARLQNDYRIARDLGLPDVAASLLAAGEQVAAAINPRPTAQEGN